MTIKYNSNDPSVGFDATTAGSLPAGWTNYNGANWQVNSSPPTFTSHTQTFSDVAAPGGWVGLTGVGVLSDVEISFSQDVVLEDLTFARNGAFVFFRADATLQNYYAAYYYMVDVGGSAMVRVVIDKTVGGSGSNLGFADYCLNGTTWPGSNTVKMNVRVQAQGSNLRIKVWLDGAYQYIPSVPENLGFDYSTTDSSIASGYVILQNNPYSGGTVPNAAITDLVVSDTPYGETNSLAVSTPAQPLGAGGTVTGNYTGTAPTGFNYSLDGNPTWTPIDAAAIGSGAFSFSMPPIEEAGYHQLSIQSAGTPTITTATAAFEGTPSVAGEMLLLFRR